MLQCKNHSNIQAKYFCKTCGFLCKPEDDTNKEHIIVCITSKLIAFIDLLIQIKKAKLEEFLLHTIVKNSEMHSKAAQQIRELDAKIANYPTEDIIMQELRDYIEKDDSQSLLLSKDLINQMYCNSVKKLQQSSTLKGKSCFVLVGILIGVLALFYSVHKLIDGMSNGIDGIYSLERLVTLDDEDKREFNYLIDKYPIEKSTGGIIIRFSFESI